MTEQTNEPTVSAPAVVGEGLTMQVDQDWLRRRIDSDPDLPCEAGPTPSPAIPDPYITGISLDGRQGDPAGTMTVTAHMSDGSERVLIQDNGNVISHWKNLDTYAQRSRICNAPDDVEILAVMRAMADDYQTSEQHHPDHVLIPVAMFNRARSLLAKLEGKS